MIKKRIEVGRDLVKEFRLLRGQTTSNEPVPKKEGKPKRQRSTPFERFLIKYHDLDNYIDGFTTSDFPYYFRAVAEENGYKYFISSARDNAIFKKLMEIFTNREICGMITFLYESEQNYLSKDRLSPTLLASRWVNTIYADFKLWLNGEYSPRKSETKKSSTRGEWRDTESTTEVGGKL